MFRLRSTPAKTLLLLGSMTLMSSLAGCGSGNPNEREFFEHAPPRDSDRPSERNLLRAEGEDPGTDEGGIGGRGQEQGGRGQESRWRQDALRRGSQLARETG